MKEEIIKLRKKGLNYKEICDILGCAKSTVSYHCRSVNIGYEETYKKNKLEECEISDELNNKVIELRLENYKYDEIYQKLKNEISKDKIRIICSLNNLTKNGINKNKPSDEEIEEFQKMYNDGYIIREISDMFIYSRQTISKYIVKRKKLSEDQLKKNRVKSLVEWRKRTKIKLVEYKGGECKCCGYNKSIKALEFHHLDPKEKDFTMSGKSWSFERLKKEADKCILVCNRCHVEIHDNLIKI